MEQPDLREIERRPLKHWNVDGLPELLMGVGWLVVGGVFALGPSRGGLFWLPVVVVLVSAKWWLRKLKERVTYPRAGYVQPRTGPRKAARVAIAASLVAAMIMVFKPSPLAQDQQGSLIVGLVLTSAFVFLANRQGTAHLLWYAAAPPVAYLCYYAARGEILPASWVFFIVGGVCVVGGTIRFARFLKNNAKQAETGA
jgi:hypothetical protein